jgi:glycosyltransferase involved in cell wall biosynthesis
MHIALVSPLFESVPPKLYGGTERVVANLCRGLRDLGHDVTLFASGDSEVDGCEVVATVPTSLRLSAARRTDPAVFHTAQLAEVVRRAGEFDVIHNHMDFFGLPLSALCDTPVVTTLHGRLDTPEVAAVYPHYPEALLVSISDAQRVPLRTANWLATVYHGLPMDHFQFQAKPGSYLAFLGRIAAEKRPDLAIKMARRAGIPLKIAAKVDPADQDYYDGVIKGQIDGTSVVMIGEISEREKSEFLGNALALLFPIDWPEPFGLVPIEAWACGTPVLARPCGSVPELHLDGITGHVDADIDRLADKVADLESFDRAACRAYAERRFSLSRMCEEYVDVYRAAIESQRQATQHFEPHDRRGGLLHPFRRAAARNRQSRIEG